MASKKRDKPSWKWDQTKTDFIPKSLKFEDLTGQRFNRLVPEYPIRTPDGVILWFCRCDCGGEKLALAKDLKKGTVGTCGCYWRWDRAKTDFVPRNVRFKDLTGQRFGALVAQFPLRSVENGVVWNCLCDCGQNVEVVARKLRDGHVLSCGCGSPGPGEVSPGKWETDKSSYIPKNPNFEDLTGRRFGRLMAEYPIRTPEGGILWFCQCDCGRSKQALTRDLLTGTITSCGCGPPGEAPDPSGKGVLAWLSDIEHIKAEDLKALWDEQGGRCALSGLMVAIGVDASLDRIDPEKGDVPGNVRWVHADIKAMKGELSDTQFLELCDRVVRHRATTIGGEDGSTRFDSGEP
ncbi:MAG: hypothetical protein EOM25_12030 [Deltaproteobacteria bacterium]|nr:hypothetical protein [Deltaproteobacteria bacterium]